MKQFKKIIAIIMMTVLLLIQGANIAMAADVGGGSQVTRIKYQVVRDSKFNITKAVVEFTGENLLNKVVLFATDQGTQAIGRKTLQYENFVQYSLTAEEVKQITGEIMIGTKTFNLGLGNFPTINDTTKIVNIDAEAGSPDKDLVIKGQNLNQFGVNGDYIVKGEYGKSGQYKQFGEGNTNETVVTVNDATSPGDKGLQSIRLIKEKVPTKDPDPEIIVEYNYNNIFSIVSNINVNEVEMYPNTGSRGDQVYFRSPEFMKAYDIYFFYTLDGTEGFSNNNKAIFKGFVPKTSESPALLTVEVPQGVELGRNYVVLAETINNEVVAQKVLKKDDEFVVYTVVDTNNRPRVTDVYPGNGPDTGGTVVGIEGKNLFRSSIDPLELTINYAEENRIVSISNDKQVVTVEYKEATYQNQTATVTRSAKVQIGGKVAFQETEPGKPRVSIGSTSDKFYIVTSKVDDANVSPQKEVLIEITTIVTVGGKEYVFEERALWDRRFVFEPSSLIPAIDSVTPSKIQIVNGELKDSTLISIRGKNFLVNRYMDDNGNAIVNYPRVLIKAANDTDANNYDFMIQKRNGVAKAYYRTGAGNLIELEGAEILVLDNSDRVVDGTVGREVGTRLLVRIPKEVPASIGMKNLQITNPTKGSNEAGQSTIKIDSIEFVEAFDSPEIDEVVPNIVPVDGGQEIQVIGSNFLEGVKVYIDGKEVTGVSREISSEANKFILKFKAPKGREGTTQLLVMNPSGGMAAAEFIYVETLQKDPKIIGFSPNKGGNGTLVFIKGDNFLKSDPTTRDTSGIGIYRLIGTRVLLDGKDINQYYTVNNNITLQPYQSKVGPLIINQGPTGARLADYYHSVILKDIATDKYYTFDVDTGARIILSDGVQNTYRGFRAGETDGEYITTKSGLEYKVKLEPSTDTEGDKLIITDKDSNTIATLEIMTPYAVSDGAIVGNRVQVLNRTEMVFYVPQLGTEKWYDLSVQNPDTKTDTRKGQSGFYYFKQPKKNPTIIRLEPSQGSSDGGYSVDIIGADFEDNGVDKSRVFIGGVEVPKSDILVSTDQKKITITKMPAYPGDLKTESESGRKTVPVVITNSDGGNAYLKEGFTYVVPTSNPRIDRLNPAKGNAAGGEIVRIFGSDFRFFEPYEDANGNAKYDNGEKFENLNGDVDENGNPKWTDIEGMKVEDLSDQDKLILPRVYFGKVQAEIIEYSDGYLVVILPKSEKGTVDVSVLNNDYGISNKMKFTYEASSPRIGSVIPAVGKKQGGDKIELNGADFVKSKLAIYELDESGQQKIKIVDMPLIHFGDVKDRKKSNRNIPITDSGGQGGSIVNGKARVEIDNLIVNYDATSSTKVVTFSVEKGEETFKFTIDGYDDTVKYIDITSLKNSEGKAYDSGYELVRIEVDRLERKLIVERGYAPYHTNMSFSSNQITVYTPSHHSIGAVPITIYNPDGGQAASKFEYRNPDSKPQIINITKDGRDPQLGKINNEDMLVHQISYRGGNILSIIGSDFRENAIIQIGDVLTFTPDKIEYQLPDRLRITMPAVNENLVGRLYRVTVVNEDGASASSDRLNPPIYIQIIKGESNPTIESITPDSGPVKGGTKVTIKGKDFRATMDGYEGKKLSVYFGEVKVPDEDVKFIDYKTLEVITPPNVPGKVAVKVENPDGELAQPIGSFTYLSSPTISAVYDPLDINETTRITTISVEGGEVIKLKGTSFAAGARVVFAPVIRKAEGNEINNANAINIGGEWYILESGTNGTEVKVIDSETLTVKTPQSKEGTKGVIVINPDKGASSIYQDLTYGLPQLKPPSIVEAELVYDRYIKVHWTPVSGARGYEIYVVINDRQTELIGNTDLTSFVYQDLEPNTRYRFIVKTIGEYGLSIASYESNTVRTGRVVGPPDTDGGITENTTTSKTGDVINITIGTGDYNKKDIVVDLTKLEYAGANKTVITIPAEIIASYNAKNITIIGGDYSLSFNPNVFAHSNVTSNKDKKDAGVRFTIENNKGDTKTGSQASLSNQYLLSADFFIGKSSTKIENLKSNISFTLDYDNTKADLRNAKEVYLGKYNDYNATWESILSEKRGFNSSIKATINKLGRYTIFGKRG